MLYFPFNHFNYRYCNFYCVRIVDVKLLFLLYQSILWLQEIDKLLLFFCHSNCVPYLSTYTIQYDAETNARHIRDRSMICRWASQLGISARNTTRTFGTCHSRKILNIYFEVK